MPSAYSVRAARPIMGMVALAWLVIGSALAASELGFTTNVSEALIARLERSFGMEARPRVAGWTGFAREQKKAPITQRLGAAPGVATDALQVVNSYFNRIRSIEDSVHWGQEDYWATPAETVASNGGDCEDYAIAKYFLLKELGVPIERLRITYVRYRGLQQAQQAHMVLAYYATPQAEPLILDNLVPQIRPGSQRTDLDPVFSFNDDHVGKYNDARWGSPGQIRQWQSVLDRLRAQAVL